MQGQPNEAFVLAVGFRDRARGFASGNKRHLAPRHAVS
jgi:hypothetical protein